MEYLIHRGEKIPLIGFGTYRLGNNERSAEVRTIRYGIDRFGMTLLDTAEMYGSGLSDIISDCDRDSLFIVDKILPSNAEKGLYRECCQQSLERLGTDHIDLYLLHWRGNVDMQDMVNNMELLKESGMIRHWGVSNFDTHEMEKLFSCRNGSDCFCDQVLYNISERGAEYDLIPWCKAHDVLVMAYSPLCNSRAARTAVANDDIIKRIAANEQKTPESLMLSFAVRNKDVVTVFKTSSIGHLDLNMQNVFVPISGEDMAKLAQHYALPTKNILSKKYNNRRK